MSHVSTSCSLALAALLLPAPAAYGQNAQWLQDHQTEGTLQQALFSPQFVGSSIQSSVNNGVVKLFGTCAASKSEAHLYLCPCVFT